MSTITVKNPLMIAAGEPLNLIDKNVNVYENGIETYVAQDDNADGYKSLTVNASIPSVTYNSTTNYGVDYIAKNGSYDYQFLTGFTDNDYNLNNRNYLEVVSGCTEIWASADFSRCSNLATLVLPRSITKIAANISNNPYLTKIYFKGTLEEWCNIYFTELWDGLPEGAYLYVSNNDGATYTLVEDITGSDFPNWSQNNPIEIGYKAFQGCGSVHRIFLTSCHGPIIIHDYAFYRCPNFTAIDLRAASNSNSSIGTKAFSECYRFTNATVRDCALDSSVFAEDYILQMVEVQRLSSIGSFAFKNCFSLESLNLSTCPEVTVIPYGMCEGCRNLRGVTFPDTLVEIRDSAFYGDALMASITIPEHVESIGSNAFYEAYIYEIVNKSSLEFTFGSTDYGYIATYAEAMRSEFSYLISSGGCIWDNVTEKVISLYWDGVRGNYSCRIPEKKYINGASQWFEYKISPDFVYQIVIGDDVSGTFTFNTSGLHPRLKEIINYSSDVQLNTDSRVNVYTTLDDSQFNIVDTHYLALDTTVLGFLPGHVANPAILTDQNITAIDFSWGMVYEPLEVDITQTNITHAYFTNTTGKGINIPATRIVRVPATIQSMYTSSYGMMSAPSYYIIDFRGTAEQWINFGSFGVPRLDIRRTTIIQNGVALDGALYINGALLTYLTIPNTVTDIPYDRFAGCKSLQSVYFEDQSQCRRIFGGAFNRCTNLSYINLPSTITDIGMDTFSYTHLGTFTVPANLTSFGTQKYMDLDSIYSDSQAYIVPANTGSGCLMDASNNSIRMMTNNGVASNTASRISNEALCGLTKLKSFTYSGGGLYVDFHDCTALETIDLTGSTITGFTGDLSYNGGIMNCVSLKTLICPETFTTFNGYIGDNYSLESVYLLNRSSVVTRGSVSKTKNFDHNVDFFVPEELIEDYHTAWSGYPNITFKPLP